MNAFVCVWKWVNLFIDLHRCGRWATIFRFLCLHFVRTRTMGSAETALIYVIVNPTGICCSHREAGEGNDDKSLGDLFVQFKCEIHMWYEWVVAFSNGNISQRFYLPLCYYHEHRVKLVHPATTTKPSVRSYNFPWHRLAANDRWIQLYMQSSKRYFSLWWCHRQYSNLDLFFNDWILHRFQQESRCMDIRLISIWEKRLPVLHTEMIVECQSIDCGRRCVNYAIVTVMLNDSNAIAKWCPREHNQHLFRMQGGKKCRLFQ